MAYGVISLALRRTGTTLRRVLDGFEISRGDINEEKKKRTIGDLSVTEKTSLDLSTSLVKKLFKVFHSNKYNE